MTVSNATTVLEDAQWVLKMLVEDVQQNPQRVLITTLAVLLPLFLLFSLRRQYSSDNWKRYDEDIFGMKDRSDDGIIKDSEQRQARMQREAAQVGTVSTSHAAEHEHTNIECVAGSGFNCGLMLEVMLQNQ